MFHLAIKWRSKTCLVLQNNPWPPWEAVHTPGGGTFASTEAEGKHSNPRCQGLSRRSGAEGGQEFKRRMCLLFAFLVICSRLWLKSDSKVLSLL